MTSKINLLKRAIAAEKNEATKITLQGLLRSEIIKAIGFIINTVSLTLIVLGYVFWSSLGFWLTEIHGALTGIFILGTVKHLINAANHR